MVAAAESAIVMDVEYLHFREWEQQRKWHRYTER